ncbi:MAG: ankyrin repeat domain-containing protein [Chloroflexi bacterium]|nr:ankyrin repeat domain-containing protein [Chloroflexota bacterium]
MTVPARVLPSHPDLDHHKKQAKALLKAYQAGDPDAAARFRRSHPRFTNEPDTLQTGKLTLSDAQLVIAREHGFGSWPQFRSHLRSVNSGFAEKVDRFLEAATPAPGQSHRSGSITAAGELLHGDPALAAASIYTAAVTGDDVTARKLLSRDRTLAAAKGGPRDWEPILYLCFSRFLRFEPDRTPAFVRTAQLLLQHGADPNSLFISNGERETALYGAAAVSSSVEITRLLVDAGADLNDGEVHYHSAEEPGCRVVEALVEKGFDLNEGSTVLLRKLDFEDLEGTKRLLELGADPNRGLEPWGRMALHQAIIRRRSRRVIDLLLRYGADVNGVDRDGKTPYALAATQGRADVVESLVASGADTSLGTFDSFLTACLNGDDATAGDLLKRHPSLIKSLTPEQQAAAVNLAAVGATAAVARLLGAGFDLEARDGEGFTALHSASWHRQMETVSFLLEKRAPLEALNRYGGTVLSSTVFAAFQDKDYCTYLPVITRLLEAGASADAITSFPIGRPEIDALLGRYRTA